jgi:hypothetical protein
MTRRQAFLLWIEASALLMLVGALGPWIKALGVSMSGTDGSIRSGESGRLQIGLTEATGRCL